MEDCDKHLSLMTPLHENPDFPPGLGGGFALWKSKGINTIGHIMQDGKVLTFDQIISKFDIPKSHFFKLLQVHDFVSTGLKLHPGGISISPIETILLNTTGNKSIIRHFYSALCSLNRENAEKARLKWEIDIDSPIDVADWENICGEPSKFLASNSAWEMQFKIIHRLHITPVSRHRMDPSLSNLCNKCQNTGGTYIHCLWDCHYIQEFWNNILGEIDKIFGRPLQLNAGTCLLGILSFNTKLLLKSRGILLLQILLHCARKCILLLWITDKPPSIAQWVGIVTNVIPWEAFSSVLNHKPYQFYKIWDPFLEYLGPDKAQTLISGLTQMAWRDLGD